MTAQAYDVDVAVVGGGGCGMVTALRAARRGLTVAVFEKSVQHGCNTQVSSGSLAAGGTRFQRAAGVEDSPARHADDIVKESGDEAGRPLVEAVCAVAPLYVEWLADELGHPVELGEDMRRHGMSAPRLHTDVDREGGTRLVRSLRQAVQAEDRIAFVDGAPGRGLIVRDGRVDGVIVEQNGQLTEVSARATVLASDGFAANEELVKRFCPEAEHDVFQGVSTATGDALTWALELGAATRHLGAFLGHGLVVPGHATRLNPALPMRGAMLVGRDGQRFVDEHAHGYSSLGAVLRNRPDRRAVLVWDEGLHGDAMRSELMRESERAGAFRRVADASALAAAFGIDQAGLEVTLGEFVGRDEVTGASRPLAAPYYAAEVTSGILATQGGVDVDVLGRVLRRDGTVISGLYAGGGAAGGLSGPDSRGYSSGNGLLSALGLGWIIGEHVTDAAA